MDTLEDAPNLPGGCTDKLCYMAWVCLVGADREARKLPLTGCCMSMQARLWQVGKLMPHKLAKHMEVSTFWLLACW